MSNQTVNQPDREILRRMKQAVYLFLLGTVMALTVGCTGQGGRVVGEDTADSTYTWENIRTFIMQQPEHALGLVDTAEMQGMADVNYANWMRAVIYYSSPKATDYGKARELCLAILENKNPEADSLRKQRTLALLTGVCANHPDTYQDAVHYAITGAEMAHRAGDIQQEADFYFQAGKVMERMQQGSGIDYMNRSLNILREASRDSIQPLTVLSPNLGNAARVLAGQENYAAAVPLLQERLQVIDRIEREYTTAPAGWIDQQRANTYSVLAYCQYKTDDKEGARLSANAFEQTQTARNPNSQADIMNYYALAGNAGRIQQIYDLLEPFYREKEDTISRNYAALLSIYATGLGNTGRYREAFLTSERFRVINDSLTQRERQEETLKYAQQMKTQEKELQLKDEEAKTRIQRILLVSAILLILLIAYLLWRSYQYNKVLLEKNRRLVAEMEQHEQEQQQAIEQLKAEPEENLTVEQTLFRRICNMMADQQPYTDETLNRDALASLLATNAKYVEQAIRECSHGENVTDFINRYRLEHVARLLKTTDESIALVGELSGIPSRSTLARLFRNAYGMTCSEFRQAARAEAK